MRSRQLSLIFLVLLSLTLSACFGGDIAIPTDHYYRLPQAQAQINSAQTVIDGSLDIQQLRANGLLHERAILYIRANRPLEINPYHYHHWADAPAAMIQAHLYNYLNEIKFAKSIKHYHTDNPSDYTLRGRLTHFERLLENNNSKTQVGLELVLYDNNKRTEIFRREYSEIQNAANAGMHETIAAFGRALNNIYDSFTNDLEGTAIAQH